MLLADVSPSREVSVVRVEHGLISGMRDIHRTKNSPMAV